MSCKKASVWVRGLGLLVSLFLTQGTAGAQSTASTTLPFATRAQGIYQWLSGQVVTNTGLLDSFDASQDTCLDGQASTYDQAISGIALCLLGDCAPSARILEFFQKTWKENGPFQNFFSTVNGRVGLEYRVHAGPNLWIALLALNYERLSGNARYRGLALDITRWAASLGHVEGGIAMSDQDDSKAPWSRIVSTENVLDFVSVLKALRTRVGPSDRSWIDAQLDSSKRFLVRVAFDTTTGDVSAGYADGKRNPWGAADTYSWFISAVGPVDLHAWGIDPERLLERLSARFRTRADGVGGIDFMDEAAARQFRDSTHRSAPRIITPEWTGQAIVAHQRVARYLLNASGVAASDARGRANGYTAIADELTKELEHLAIVRADGRVSYPYASAANEWAFMHDWRTPKTGVDGGRVGSIAGTAWVVFANLGYDPMDPFAQEQRAKSVKANVTTRSARRVEDGWLRPSTTCNSAGLVDAAWLNFDSTRFATADSLAAFAIREHRDTAMALERLKQDSGGKIIHNPGGLTTRRRIFRYGVLNDVAAALFIRGLVALERQQPTEAREFFREIVRTFPSAQVWDPRKDIFWTPATAVLREYAAVAGYAERTAAQRLAAGEPAFIYRTFDAPENGWVPSGWMGDTAIVSFAEVAPESGDSITSIRISYTPSARDSSGWAGIYFQHPENNWGTEAGRDVRGAVRLVLSVRGTQGDRAEFLVGGVKGPKTTDSIRWARSTGVVTLTGQWQDVVIDVTGLDLSNVIGSLAWVTSRLRSPKPTQTFIRSIRFEPR